MRTLNFLLFLISSCGVFALYTPKSPVIQLDSSNFDKTVLNGDGVWYVEFYAPWCGHCQKLVGDWEKAAKALKGIVNIAAVDATASEDLARKYDIKGFPTIKIFGENKKKPSNYEGERTAKAIVAASLDTIKQVIAERSGPKKDSKKEPKEETKHEEPAEPQEPAKPIKIDTKCHEITKMADFDESNKLSMVVLLNPTETTKKTIADVEAQLVLLNSPLLTCYWSLGGVQTSLEESLQIPTVYPQAVVVAIEKKSFALYKGSFSANDLIGFARGVLNGLETVSKYKHEWTVVEMNPWDGVVPGGEFEEEFSLEDLGI